MIIAQQAAPIALQSSRQQASSAPVTDANPSVIQDTVSSSEAKTPIFVKAGKVALLLAATAGAGAAGYYAGQGSSAANVVAGAVTGAFSGALTLGAVGLMADVGGGIMGNSNHTPKFAAAGALLGLAAGGFASGNSIAGYVLAGTAGLSAALLTGAATNILHK